MSPVFVILLVVGCIALIVGGIMMLVAAFQESALWGLVYIFVPFGNLIFLICHWEEAKRGFKITLIGVVVLGIAAGSARALLDNPKDSHLAVTAKSEEQDLTAKIAQQREHISQLENQINENAAQLKQEYAALAAKRQTLKANDVNAVALFNQDAAAYGKKNENLKQLRRDVAAASEALTQMLAARSQVSSGASAGGATAPAL